MWVQRIARPNLLVFLTIYRGNSRYHQTLIQYSLASQAAAALFFQDDLVPPLVPPLDGPRGEALIGHKMNA